LMVWFRFYSTSIIFDTVEDFNGTTAIFKLLEPVKISGLEIFIS